MRLFNFVEQDNLIGSAPHGLGQYTTLVIADITGRCPDQTRHGMFFHELGHVDPHHRVLVVEQKLGHGFGKLGFTHTGWPEEKETTQRACLVIQTSPRTTHRISNGTYRLVLTNDTVVQLVFHSQQLVPFSLQHATGRNTCPTFNHARNLVGTHGLFHHHISFAVLGLAQLTFKLRNHTVRQLTSLGQVALAFGNIQLCARTIQLLFQLT